MKQIIIKNIHSLKPYERNARRHSDKQVIKISSSIKKYGFNNPVLTNKNNMIVAGHGRYGAL